MTDKTKNQDTQELVELRKEYSFLKATHERELDNKKAEESILRKLILSSQDFIQFTNDTPDYNKILQLILDISGAKYAVLNVFDENGPGFTTVGIAGIKENIIKGMHLLGLDIQNKHWNQDLNRAEKTKQQIITRFSNLNELTGNVVSQRAIALIEKTFGLKETFIVKVVKENKVLGDFTLLFNNGETLKNSSFVELYANQVGLFLDRLKGIYLLQINEARHSSMISNISDVIGIVGTDGIMKYKSPNIEKWFGWLPEDLVGTDGWLTVHPDDLERIQKEFQILLEEDNSVRTVEYKYLCKDGSYKPIELTAKNLINDTTIGGVLMNYHDITERKRVEEELIMQNSLFNTLLQNLHIGVYMIEVPSGMPLLANEASFNLLGRGILPEANSSTITKVYDLYKTGTDIPYPNEELPIVVAMNGVSKHVDDMDVMKPNRERITLEVFGSPVRNEKGNIWASLVTFQDITKRKHIEQELKDSEEKLRNYFQLGLLGMAITSIEKGWIEVNDTICEILGYTKEELYQKTWSEFTHPEDINKDLSFYERVLNDEIDGYRIDKRFIRKNGDVIYTELAVKCIRNADRSVNYFLALINDISERKQAEQALKESGEKLLLLMNSTAEGIYGIDLKGNCTHANKSCIESIGYKTEKDLIGKNMHDLIHHSYSDNRPMNIEVCKIYLAFRQGKGTHVDDEVLWRADGTSFPVEYYSYPIFKNEQIVGAVVTFIDITERKHAELKIRQQNNELVKLSADKDLFLEILGHDLRSPFNVLLGLSDLLNEKIQDFDINQIRKMVGDINKSAQNTFNLLEDILLWARIQQGRIPFQPQKMSLTDAFQDSVNVLRPNAEVKNITIIHSVEKELTVFADIDMLKTVLRNLVSNAIKFTNNGGLINIIAEQTPSGVTVSVSDNGVGLSHDNIAKLFVVGQVQTTKGTDDEKGTGLGLLLCKEFVEKHSGKIWVESEVGKGSAFKFTLPLSGEHANAIKN